MIQYRNPKNYDLVEEALIKAGRTDLIGFDQHCLIRPRRVAQQIHMSRQRTHQNQPGKGPSKTMPTAEVLRTEHETREGESGKEMGKIRILADSTCDLTPQMLQQYGVQIVPLNIVLNDKAYQDGVEIGPDEIYAWSEAHKTTPKTSAMTLGAAPGSTQYL